jgi:methionyl-tRNA formyltransferase
MKPLKTVFLGTPEITLKTIEYLNTAPEIELVEVISMPDRPSGRGKKLKSPDVITYAKENNISYFQTENINKENEHLVLLKDQGIDLIIVFAFAQFLSDEVLNLPKIGCFNIHTSLLPKYRGAAPIQYALMNGDKSTGVSIQKMVKKMDAGDIATSLEVTITPTMTGGELYQILMEKAPLALDNLVHDIIQESLTFKKQNEEDVSFAPTLKKEDGFINFKSSTYNDIYNKIRALKPWPGSYCLLNQKRLKIFNIEKSNRPLTPGDTECFKGELLVGCLDTTIRLKEIQLEGKKACFDTDLLNGLRENIVINP